MKKVFGLLAAIVLLAAGSWVWQQVDAPESFASHRLLTATRSLSTAPMGKSAFACSGLILRSAASA